MIISAKFFRLADLIKCLSFTNLRFNWNNDLRNQDEVSSLFTCHQRRRTPIMTVIKKMAEMYMFVKEISCLFAGDFYIAAGALYNSAHEHPGYRHHRNGFKALFRGTRHKEIYCSSRYSLRCYRLPQMADRPSRAVALPGAGSDERAT